MKRNTWIILGVVMIILIGVLLLVLWTMDGADPQADPGDRTDVSKLGYCTADGTRPCVVSFGVDEDENMLVNLLLPETSFPPFRLVILRGTEGFDYACQRVLASPANAYCTGPKLPPGETLHLMLLSTRNDILLAEGDLAIIGLALPTVGIVTPGPTTSFTATPTLSPSPAPTSFPTFLPTKPSYSNPTSYPNPSYP